jgi:transcriptional regulator with XRE-family HTH domain
MGVSESQVRKALGILMASVTPDDRDECSPEFGELIKDARKTAGMSLQAVADAMHSSKAHLWEVEQGRTNPSTKFVWEICKVLPIDPLVALQSAAQSYSRKGAFSV